MCHTPFSRRKVKVQGHMGSSKFLPCPLCRSAPISPIHFICSAHSVWNSVKKAVCPHIMPWISNHKHKIKEKLTKTSGSSPKLWASDRRTCGRNFQHWIHTQPMRSEWVAHHFQVKMVKLTLVIWSFCHVRSVASALFVWITSYVTYIQHMRGAMCHVPPCVCVWGGGGALVMWTLLGVCRPQGSLFEPNFRSQDFIFG